MLHTARRLSLVFPGQGSQRIGMGKELLDKFPRVTKEVYGEVDEALQEFLSRVIFEGTSEEINQTSNAQPALLATSIAAFRCLEVEYDLWDNSDVSVHSVLGHSLGEYSGLVAAEALSLFDAARVVRFRGQAMQLSAEEYIEARGLGSDGIGMAALIRFDQSKLHEFMELLDREFTGEDVCQVANVNNDAQIVISGDRRSVTRAIELAKSGFGARKAMWLPVSAPFHCSLMAPAASALREILQLVPMENPRVPVISNVTAEPVTDAEAIRELLVEQATKPVRWSDCVARCVQEDAGSTEGFVELGGSVLGGLARQMKGVTVPTYSVHDPDTLSGFGEFIKR